MVCNCSICQRNGYLLVYPIRENLKLGDGSEEAMGSYRFGNKNVKHNFCKECGSSVFFEVLSPPKAAELEAEAKGEKLPVIMGVNVSNVQKVFTSFKLHIIQFCRLYTDTSLAKDGERARGGQIDYQESRRRRTRAEVRNALVSYELVTGSKASHMSWGPQRMKCHNFWYAPVQIT